MTKENKEFNLEDRLIDFAVGIIYVAESLPKTKTGNHFAGQPIRCGTVPAYNYGEFQDKVRIRNSGLVFQHSITPVLQHSR